MAWTERYVRADAAGGGDGTTDTNSGANGAFTLAEAITHSASNTNVRYNVKAGTYTNTTTSRTFNGVALTTAPNWWRGFKTTAGDKDTAGVDYGTFASGTELPFFSFTTGKITVSGAHQIFSNIDIRGASGTGQFSITGANVRCVRLRIENTNALNVAVAADGSAANYVLSSCWLKATTTATRVFNASGGSGIFRRCIFASGINGIDTAVTILIVECIFQDNTGHGARALAGTGGFSVIKCTFYSQGLAGVRLDTAPTNGLIVDNVFSEYGTYGIENNSGGAINTVARSGNVYYNTTTGTSPDQEHGFGDSPTFGDLTETAQPYTDGAGGNFAIVDTSVAYGVSGRFNNIASITYADKGAVQHLDTSDTGTGNCPPCPEDTGTGSLICPECPDDTGTGTTTTVYVHTGSPFNGPF